MLGLGYEIFFDVYYIMLHNQCLDKYFQIELV